MDRAFHPQIVLRLPSSTRIVTAVLYLHHRRLLRDTICPIGVSCVTPSALSASRSLSSPSSIASRSLLLASNLSSSVYRCVAVLCHCVAVLCRSHRHPLPLTSSSSAARVAVLHLPQASSRYIIVVENDLCVLDYLSDFICCLYGKPGAYGVVTLPFSVREGINIFLAGFDPTENLRFRDESLTFKVAETPREEIGRYARYKYPSMSKTQGDFKLKVMEGELCESQITVLPEENGTGKTTFIRMLAGLLKPDSVEGSDVEIPELNVSYKPQKISPTFEYTVRMLLHQKIRDSYTHPQFVSDVMKPLLIEQLMDKIVE